MPGPAPTHKIVFASEHCENVRQLVRSQTVPYSEVVQAKIIVLAADRPDLTNVAIAQMVGCAERTVGKWRERYAATHCLTSAPRAGSRG
jgi:hypothetical protein